MNLLALDMMDKFRPYLYLGSHYSIHSALYSYLAYPFFFIFGPTDFSMELVAALFHLATIIVCFKLAEKFISRTTGLIFAYLVSVAPIYLINIYTWSEYGLVAFLNVLSVYIFCLALSGSSPKKAVAAALLYSASCLQAIYSLLLFPFFIILPLCLWVCRGRRYRKSIFISAFLFAAVTAAILILAEIFVQLDMNFFGQYFGYYRDSTFAGGFGTARPQFIWAGRLVTLFGRPWYFSVLTSITAFSSGYARVAFNIFESASVMKSYYRMCYPAAINLFFIIGLSGLIFIICRNWIKRQRLPGFGQVLLVSWFVAVCVSFVNVYPYHLLKIYIMPMPYLFAALAVKYMGDLAKVLTKRRSAQTAVLVILTSFLVAGQLLFSYVHIFCKYKHDKARSMYYDLYHGWRYGRSYREVGDYLLKDAPLKKDGKFRSIFIYTVSPYTGRQGNEICSVLYNSIDWVTRNKINIIYDDIHTSYNKYGTPESLRNYLYQLFFKFPEVQAIYFADFRDNGDNYSFFSRLYPGIKPYAVVNDDDRLDYDCVLYKFERANWLQQLNKGV